MLSRAKNEGRSAEIFGKTRFGFSASKVNFNALSIKINFSHFPEDALPTKTHLQRASN